MCFFADLEAAIAEDVDDLYLAGRAISHVEQADDVALWSTTLDGLQRKLSAFFEWCRTNFMTISVSKTEWMMFGGIPTGRRLFPLVVNGSQVALVAQYKYVGIVFTSTKRDIFYEHYVAKAVKAMRVASVIFSLENHVGVLTVAVGCRLYQACVDPHLTFGSEVALDVHKAGIARLERVQVYFLRRLLGLTKRSKTIPLFTETGVMPLRYRRIVLVLRYAQYVWNLPERVFAASGMKDSLDLHRQRVQGWVMDLEYVLYRLPCSVVAPTWDAGALKTKEWLAEVVDRVYRSLCFGVAKALDAASKETRSWTAPWTGVQNPEHRRALSRLVSSNHRLAVEVLRRGDGQRRRPVPREWRLCRFCREEVEDEVHALLLVSLRAGFWTELDGRDAGWRGLRDTREGFFVLHMLLSSERVCARFGRFVSEVFALFDGSVMFLVARSLYEHVGGTVADADVEDDDVEAEDEDSVELLDADDYMALALRGFG
ncbi:hypothetical protein BDZ89DRAFT_1094556 [Hymenopellis radicata]|nr:hypothetical protein BDZ89DRAFT_1094556 [Hymenopellis radicata]